MEEKIAGIVLSSVAYGESDKILTIFSLEKGIISAKIKGVKKAGAKLKFASEPFCFAEFIITGANLKTVIGASLIDSFYPIRENIIKFYAGATALEITKKFFKDGIVSSEFFALLASALKEITYGEKPLFSLIKFILVALEQTGYALNLDGCFSCEEEINGRIFFDFTSGGFLCENCRESEGREINLATYLALKDVLSDKIPQNGGEIASLKLLSFYIQNKIEVVIKALNDLINVAKY